MNSFVLDGADLWIGDGTHYQGHLVIADGRIAAIGAGPYKGAWPVTKLTGQSLSPGLIDSMVCGGFGFSAASGDEKALRAIAREYLKHGVTSLQFCSGALAAPQIERVVAAARTAQQWEESGQAKVLGLYPEGPFLLPHCSGAQLSENAWPASKSNIEHVIQNWSGVARMINISPGIEGDALAIRRLKDAGFIVTMAHSDADAARVEECLTAGTSILGHAWDNNKGLQGESDLQQPTLEHLALLDERVEFIHLICDGHHVHPMWLKLTLKCRGIRSLILVSDAAPCAGCADGIFTYDDGQTFEKKDGTARRTTDGGLFGAAMLLPDNFRTFIQLTRIPPHEAIQTVTHNPAVSLNLDSELGLLTRGHVADIVAWDDKLQVSRIWQNGVEVE